MEPPNAQLAQRAQRFVFAMGIVAMFGDLTYEGARGLSGPYLALLGASATLVGFTAGLGELLGYGLRLVSGWLSDRTRAYWPLVAFGYGLNLVAVPGLALVGRYEWAIALILLERVGKAIRSPARATLVSSAARMVGSGRSFGLEEALDQLGAVGGPLLTVLVFAIAPGEALERFRAAYLVLLLPVLGNLLVLAWARRQLPRPEVLEPASRPVLEVDGQLRWLFAGAMLVGLGFADWALVAFHGLRSGGWSAGALPLFYALAMGIDGLAALGLGRLYDRHGPKVLAGTAVVSAVMAPLAFGGGGPWTLIAAAVVFGVGMGAQESIYKAALEDRVPLAARGRIYGRFFAAFGGAWWLGSTVMGWLYDHHRGGLIAFSVATQLLAVPCFWRLKRSTS